MTHFRNAILLLFATAWITLETADAASATSPGSTVKSFYHTVLAHPRSGLLDETNRTIFAPYLSRSLLRRMAVAEACAQDWYRKNPKQDEKAPFGWSEFGMFTGANERVSPGSFQIKNINARGDGSFAITTSFTYLPSDGPGSWRVMDTLIREDGRFVLDEVTFPAEEPEASFTLSQRISEGCEGPRWVGNR